MNREKMKHFAFTLAETLVTLAIIGVVMALMLRAVNRVSPNKDKLLYIKAYRAVEQVIEETINDQDKYDQSTYTTDQRNAATEGTLHEDFRDAPFDTYESSSCGGSLNANNAICCFLADGMNTIGTVNCSDTADATTVNFRSSNGVCYIGWTGAPSKDAVKTGYVATTCDKDNSYEIAYKIQVAHNGKVSIPSEGTEYEWMTTQTDLK